MDKILEGQLVTSKSIKRGQILYDSVTGLIKDVGDLGVNKKDVDYYYDDQCLVFAGMGDVHIHAREDVSGKHTYKEDYISASQAAKNGGVTHCCDMPNNPTAPIDDETYKAKLELTKKGEIPLFIYAGIGPGTKPLSTTVPYKAYMGPSVGDLFFKNHKELDQTLSNYKGEFVSFHCEDPEILEASQMENTHLGRRPVEAELMATEVALKLIEKYELKGKLCHYSAGDGLPRILEAKSRGIPVQCEVTPQHLYFCEEMLLEMPEHKRIYFQMNPPIRGEKDRDKMLAAFLKGDIDFLATDHAPHTHSEKKEGTSGLTGLDTYGAFVTWLIKNKNADPKLIAKTCSENPGDFVNQFLSHLSKFTYEYDSLGKGFGYLEEGYVASFTVLNMDSPTTIDNTMLKTKVGWSPFEGITFPGSVESVFIKGHHHKY